MKINKKAKKEIRSIIEEQLKTLPDGQRISLDNELLDELLFEKITVIKESGQVLKLPIWSGEFLRKIDLSGINFTDVSFGVPDVLYQDEKLNIDFDQIMDDYMEVEIDYSYTNANIDFTKLFEYKFGHLSLINCNLKGLNFEAQDLSGIESIHIGYSNLADTKIVIPENVKLTATCSDLSNIDLSTRKINVVKCLNEYHTDLDGCCLLNTGINIEYDVNEYQNFISKSRFKEVYKRNFREAISENWVGCFLNGKKIIPVEEKRKNAEQKNQEYNQLKNDIINSVTESIQTQVNEFKTR